MNLTDRQSRRTFNFFFGLICNIYSDKFIFKPQINHSYFYSRIQMLYNQCRGHEFVILAQFVNNQREEMNSLCNSKDIWYMYFRMTLYISTCTFIRNLHYTQFQAIDSIFVCLSYSLYYKTIFSVCKSIVCKYQYNLSMQANVQGGQQ